MNWKSTWVLVAVAGVLAAFILLFERHSRPTYLDGTPPARPISIRATEVTNVQLRLTNQLALRVERAATDAPWQLTVPIVYPAHAPAIDWLLQSIESATSATFIPPEELSRNQRTAADFGLDPPKATLTLQHRGQRVELHFGAHTPAGDGVYLQVAGERGIHAVAAELFDRLPRNFHDWRDTTLVSLSGVAFNRMEVRSPARGFAVEFDLPNKSFRLTKPSPARADGAKLEALWRKILTAHVHGFVSDNPRADEEPFGLQPPEAELVFGAGTNDLVVVQFGKSPTNDSSLVYARRMTHTNVVLAPRSVLEAVLTPHAELRDRRLMTFELAQADSIEVTGPGAFTLRRQTNGAWAAGDAATATADPELVKEWMVQMVRLEGNVEKDFVTDFATLYGLAAPSRQCIVRAAATNATGGVSNRVLAELDFGARAEGKVFVRRPDEQSVYSLPATDVDRLPAGLWQLRDRRVWSFTTNQIARVTIRQRGYVREMIRNGPAAWSFAEGSQGVLNGFAVEEAMHRLGQLRAGRWVARTAAARAQFGFRDDGHKITLELKNGARPAVLTLEFGGPSPLQIPYALAEVDGEPWVFEFPVTLYFDIVRYLSNPPRE